jgi:hypothetical protein
MNAMLAARLPIAALALVLALAPASASAMESPPKTKDKRTKHMEKQFAKDKQKEVKTKRKVDAKSAHHSHWAGGQNSKTVPAGGDNQYVPHHGVQPSQKVTRFKTPEQEAALKHAEGIYNEQQQRGQTK